MGISVLYLYRYFCVLEPTIVIIVCVISDLGLGVGPYA